MDINNEAGYMRTRRSFIKSGTAFFSALPVFADDALASQRDKDRARERSDPGRLLLRHGQEYAKRGRDNNIIPVLREEIFENPHAVFILRTDLDTNKDQDGRFPAEKDWFERTGYDTAHLLFRKGSARGGVTVIKPNFVGGWSADERSVNRGITTHPWFVAGFSGALADIGNSNIVVCAGGASHKGFVDAGISELMHDRGICFVEGKYDSWDDYKKSEITWVDYPDGVVMKKIPFYRLVKDDDTLLINMAKDRIHQLGYTTLTVKNLQGIMPVGYKHICRPWSGNLQDVRSLEPSKKVIHPDFQREIERRYIRHARMNFKYWDEGGFARDYFRAGGWNAFKKGSFIPDSRIFWSEQWGQRMMDVASNIKPCLNMVEGVIGVDGAGKLHLNNYITVSRSMIECDAVTGWLMGHDPREMPYLRIANERGLGQNNIDKIDIYEIGRNGTISRVRDYRILPRARMGVWVYRVNGAPLRFF